VTFVLTGPPRSGKTTAVNRLVELLRARGMAVGGMTTSEAIRSGTRIGFEITDVSRGIVGTLASVGGGPGPRVGKYVVNRQDLEDIGVGAIEYALEASEIIVIDEIGPMELTSTAFVNAVESALSSEKPLVLTVHWRARHPLIERIRREAAQNVFDLTTSNRSMLPVQVEERVLRAVRRAGE